MDTMINVWTVVENVRVASGAAELAIFTALLYWFFTSSRVADMLEVVGERVGGWCGRDSSASLRQAVRRRHRCDVYSKIEQDTQSRTASLYRVKEGPVLPAPQPVRRPPAGLACSRCAPISRESWQDPKASEQSSVINILDIGRQKFANGGVVSRYLCDLAQCCHLVNYDYKDIVEDVQKDERFQSAIEETTAAELRKANTDDGEQSRSTRYQEIRRKVEAKARKVLMDITSAMSNNVLKLVAWVCHKAIRRIADGGCVTRSECVERLRRAKAAGLPLVFVPLHRSHLDYILVTFTLYLTGLRPPLVAAGDNMRIPFFGWFLRGCGAFYIKRRADGSDNNSDPIYKSALRAYILNSLAANNNLEFFIEGGRTRTGKPQPPKAGILSVIMDAYLDGTIDDALLVPVTLNYDKLVDGNFVREQLGMPKQMETFWSALRGIWSTLHTNHGTIRVDFNQPISLKELVTSFKNYNYLKSPIERTLPPPNNNLAVTLDKQILYNHSHSSLYGADVSTDHKMMVEAIGRHVVYDAAQATPLMCTNVVSYVLLTEHRAGCSITTLVDSVRDRGQHLVSKGRDLGYSGDTHAVVNKALEILGRSLVRRSGSVVRSHRSVSASLQLSYYANAVVAHYAPSAIMATALESVLLQNPGSDTVTHSSLIDTSLQLCEVLSREFILCAACERIQERMADTIAEMQAGDVIARIQEDSLLEEQRWSRRFARSLEEEDEQYVQTTDVKYRVSNKPEALAERRRLLLTIRPLLEAYAASCECLRDSTQKQAVKTTLELLTERVARRNMNYGEAVSTDAIKNCHRLLKQWGVIDIRSQHRERVISVAPPYRGRGELAAVCGNITKFNVDSPLLKQ